MTWGEPAFALALVPLATLALLRLAPRLLDAPAQAPERKLQVAPVPAVGGPALALAVGLWLLLAPLLPFDVAVGPLREPAWTWTLLLALAVGLADDLLRDGLGPGVKFGLQCLAAAPLVLAAPGPDAVLLALAAVAAMNVLNTFDNADGALAALTGAALIVVAPFLGLCLLAFLPFNVGRAPFGARPGDPRRRPPLAYLGDSGSHALGVLVLAHPWAWGAFLLPALDLARVVVVRLAAGDSAFQGDRRHLAHRFEASGWPPWLVVVVQLAVAAPALLVGVTGAWERPAALALGCGATALLFGLALVLTRTSGRRPTGALEDPPAAAEPPVPTSGGQRLVAALLPARAWSAVAEQSRRWLLRCPACGHADSLWDLGGVRYGASRGKRVLRRCPACGERRWQPLELAPREE